MTELEKVAYARVFIEKLANGINPLDNTPIPEGDLAGNARLSRCFFYVSDLLGQIIENGEKHQARCHKKERGRFHITKEELRHFEYSEEPIALSEFCRRLEALADLSNMKRISRFSLPRWLVHRGLLCEPTKWERHCAGKPTEQGLKIGITQIKNTDRYGPQKINALGPEAQKYVIDNIDDFLAFRERSKWKI